MTRERRPTLSNHLVLLAGAGAVVLWGCTGGLQPPIDGGGGAGGAGIPDGVAGAPGPWVPGPCIEPVADAALARFRTGMVGSWQGTATAPLGWQWSTASVELTFFCDGHYQARCLATTPPSPGSCVALYSGTAGDDPKQTYEVYDVRSDGKATGTIAIASPMDPRTSLDDLRAIDLSAAGDRLAFDLFHAVQYGPIHYELQRQP